MTVITIQVLIIIYACAVVHLRFYIILSSIQLHVYTNYTLNKHLIELNIKFMPNYQPVIITFDFNIRIICINTTWNNVIFHFSLRSCQDKGPINQQY